MFRASSFALGLWWGHRIEAMRNLRRRKTVPLVARKQKERKGEFGVLLVFQCHVPHDLMTSYSASVSKGSTPPSSPTLRTKTGSTWVFPGCLRSKLYQTVQQHGCVAHYKGFKVKCCLYSFLSRSAGSSKTMSQNTVFPFIS